MTDQVTNFESEIEDGKNKRRIQCKYCKSIILNSRNGDYINVDFQLPVVKLTKQKNMEKSNNGNEESTVETELVSEYWLIKKMYTFENMGFSNTVENTKYLCCADCELGPLGYHNLTTKESYLAVNRVKYID